MFQSSDPTKHLHLKSSFELMPCFVLLFIVTKYFTIIVIYIIVMSGFHINAINIVSLWHCLWKSFVKLQWAKPVSDRADCPGCQSRVHRKCPSKITLMFAAGNVCKLIFVVIIPFILSLFNIFHLPKFHTTYVFVFLSRSLTITSKALAEKL